MNRNDTRMRSIFLKAFIGLAVFDLFGLARDFAKLHRTVRNWKTTKAKPSTDAVDRVCRAVNRACIWYPKRALCLQRSAVTTCLLRDCGVPAQMVFGAQKLPFKAHAWVEVNDQAINERRDVKSIYAKWERC
jgi:hypothetical protein